MDVLNFHAPLKRKLVRANNAPFMNSKLRKAIMTRTRLKNKFRKHSTADNEKAYKNQRNLCVKLTKQSKRLYYNNLDTKHIADNKNFKQNYLIRK